MLDKKPREAMICGNLVKIKYKKRLKDLGQFYADENEIFILNDDKWREHLIHEILHAILFYSGHSEKLGEKDEEALVRALENGIRNLGLF
jgi:hypothetical protein